LLTHHLPPPKTQTRKKNDRGGGGGGGGGGLVAGGGASSSDPSSNPQHADPQARQPGSNANGGPLTTAVFGVLYTLAKEKISESRAVALLSLLVDFLLIGGILLLPEYPWALPAGHGLQKLVYYIEFHLPIARTVE
jgi:hypothetical protein